MSNEIVVLNKAILEKVSKSFSSVSKDATRYALNSVLIEPIGNDSVKVVACDGHQLAINTLSMENCTITKKVLIDRSYEKALKAILREYKKADDSMLFTFESNEKGISFKYTLGANTVMLECSTSYAYPDYTQVIPSMKGYDYSIALNPELILKAYESIKNGDKSPMIRFLFKDSKSPLIITSGLDIGVIMPMRDKEKPTQWGLRGSNNERGVA